MIKELPKACDHGAKRNARCFLASWRGWKLHPDTADCGVPVSALLTSASVHDSQAAIPLAKMTAGRVTSLSTSWTRPVTRRISVGYRP